MRKFVDFLRWLFKGGEPRAHQIAAVIGIVIAAGFLFYTVAHKGALRVREVDADLPVNVRGPAEHAVMANLGKSNHETVTVYFATDRTFETVDSTAYFNAFVWGLSLVLIAVLAWFVLKRLNLAIICLLIGTAVLAFGIWAFFNPPESTYAFQSGRGNLSYGWCEVGIPDNHTRGDLERPARFLGFEFWENPEEHIVAGPAHILEEPRFFEAVNRALGRFDPDLLVFVHGYNVTFDDAARRTGQLAYDLPFHGVASFFSWPSRGGAAAYTVDEAAAEFAQKHLRQYLRDLTKQTKAKRIFLVAHSMGNRLMTESVRVVADELDDSKSRFTELILAAPDIDRDYFVDTVLPELATRVRRITLYASSKDKALNASHSVHNGPRAGDAGAHIVVREELETIDASNVDTDFLSHGYFSDDPRVVSDILGVLGGHGAKQRPGLEVGEQLSLQYWFFAPVQ